LQNKVSSPKQYILYEILKNIAKGYEHWNRFDYRNAKNKIKNALDKAYQYIGYNIDSYYEPYEIHRNL